MLDWVIGFFRPNRHPTYPWMTYEEVEKMEAEIEAEIAMENEVQTMRFIIALSNALYPGDNKAVERVEQAFKDAIKVVSE